MAGSTTESLATDFRDLLREMTVTRAEFASYREDFAGFRGRVDAQFAILQWLGGFTAAILVTLVGSAIWLSWHASAMDQRMVVLERTTGSMSQKVESVGQRVESLERTTTNVAQRVESLEKAISKLLDRFDQTGGPIKPKDVKP